MSNGDYRRQFKAGEPLDIPAATANDWQRAAALSSPLQNTQKPGIPGSALPEGLIYVQNNSGADRKDGEVLGIDSILFSPSDNLSEFQYHFAIKGVTPTAQHSGKFVVCYEPIPQGDIGRAYIGGVCPVRVGSALTGISGLDVSPGDPTQLVGGGATQLLYAAVTPDTNGQFWALIRFQFPLPPGGEIYQGLEKVDSSGTVAWDYARWASPGTQT